MAHARGKHALGICDRCGSTYLLKELKHETQKRIRQSTKMCPTCFDLDHPQWFTKNDVVDHEGLKNPRPDKPVYRYRNIKWGWKPVLGFELKTSLGFAFAAGQINQPPVEEPVEEPPPPDGSVVVLTGGVSAAVELGSINTTTQPFPLGTDAQVSGVEGIGQIGTAVFESDLIVPVNSVVASGIIGQEDTIISGSAAVISTGATMILGSVTVKANASTTLTGVNATGQARAVSVIGKAGATLTGLSATGAVGSVGVSLPVVASSPTLASSIGDAFAATTSQSLPLPTGVTSGDLLVVGVSTTGDATITMPGGWTLIRDVTTGTTNAHTRLATWQKIAGASEGAPTLTITPSAIVGYCMARITGADSANPVDVSSQVTGTGGSVTFTGVTTTVANTRLLAPYAFQIGTASASSVPTGFTNIYDNGAGAVAMNVSHKAQAAAGATGGLTATISSASAGSPWASQLIAVKGQSTTPAPAPTANVTYTTHSTEIANPERGWILPVYDNQAATYYQNQRATGDLFTTFRVVVALNDYKTMAIPQTFLDGLTTRFNNIRNGGGKAVLRFWYDGSSAGADAPVSRILSHLDQLTPFIQANADIICHWEAGLIGGWGEWAYSQNFGTTNNSFADYGITAQNWADRKAVVDKILTILRTLPYWRCTSLRTPTFMQYMYGTTPISDANRRNNSDVSRIGQYNDAFVANSTDFGTYKNRTTELTYLNQQCKWTYMGGESEYQSGYGTCSVATSEMAQAHWTFCNPTYNTNTVNLWKSGGCYEAEMSLKLGYRLRMISATLPTTQPAAGGAMTINISMNNDGYAAPINKHPVKLVLRNNATSAVTQVTLAADCRDWQPGAFTINETVTVPALPAGTYSLLLNICDEAPGLSTNPLYSIQLANVGTWESTTGYNKLNHNVTVS